MNRSESNEKIHARYRKKTAVVLSIAGAFILVFFVLMQFLLQISARRYQELDNDRFFASTLSNLNDNVKEIDSLSKGYDENNRILLNDLVETYSYNNYKKLKSMPVDKQCDLLLYTTYSMDNCIWLFLVNRDADILVSNLTENIGQNVIKDGDVDLSPKQFQELCDGKIDRLVVDSPYTGADDIKDYGTKLYLYCKPIPGAYDDDGNKYIFLAFSSRIIEAAETRMNDLSTWLNGSTLGTNGAAFMVDAATDTVMYGNLKGTDMTGLKASEAGFDQNVLKDGFHGRIKIAGTRCYTSVRSYSSELYGKNSYLIAAVPERDLYGVNISVIVWNMCLVIIFSVLILAYSSYMRSEFLMNKGTPKGIRLPGNLYFSKELSRKILPVVTACAFIVFLLSFYFMSLMQLSDAFSESVAVEEEITRNVEDNNKLQNDFLDYYDQQYLSRAKMMSFIVELNGEKYFGTKTTEGLNLINNTDDTGRNGQIRDEYNNLIHVVNNSTSLRDLGSDNNVYDVYLISDTGVTLATSSAYWNYSLSTDPKDSTYELRDILSGKKDSVILDVITDENGWQTQSIGCAMYYYTCLDDDRNTIYMNLNDYMEQTNGTYKGNEITRHRGLLQIDIDPEMADWTMDGAKPEYVLDNTEISNDGFLIGFQYNEEDDDYYVFYSPIDSMINKSAKELGIPQKAFLGNYNGFQTIDSERYLQSFRQSDEYYIATAMPLRSLNLNCISTSVFCAVFSLFIMFIISCYTIILGDMDDEERYREEHDLLAIFGHWEKDVDRKENSPTRIFESIIRNCLIFLGCVFLASVFFEAFHSGNNSVIRYIFSGEWDKGVHIFSLSACFVIIIVSAVLIRIFERIAGLIASAFGNRGVTMMRLITGLIKLAAIALVIFYCLYLLGIDATSLIASAGIMSVVVGLGAQTLIGDFLAGIFIIMEGSLAVGDYVLIDGVRGRVTEIGLRTTRYEDDYQNIRIICNNELKSFANMSMKYSVVLYNIPVPYNEDYVRIRRILNEEFIRLYEDNRSLKGIPVCQGIEAFSESSVDLRVRFMCREDDRYDVQRFMYDNIMRIFTENGISVPFNQLDVHVDRLLAPELNNNQKMI